MLLLGSLLLLPPSLEAPRNWIVPYVPSKDPSRPTALSRPPSSPCPEQGPGCSAGEHHLEHHSEHLPENHSENQRGGFAPRPSRGSGSPSHPKAREAGRDLRALLGRNGAKHSMPVFEGERESGGTRQSEGLQRGAELPGKEKEEVDKTGKYRFKDSRIGNSWLIGDDSDKSANAYINYIKGCEETLKIPYTLTDESGNTKKVEVIGKYAFRTCGDKDFNGTTRSIVLSRYIKVIKYLGLGNMDDVTSFRIEEGSCLESIEEKGLSYMSYQNTNEDARRSILVLPSTVTSIAENGLYRNNLIKTIYYCGSTNLSNYSTLVNGVNAPDIKATSSYTHAKIFRDYKPNKTRESIEEAEKKCNTFAYGPKLTGFPGRGRPSSLLSWMGGRRRIGSLRRGGIQAGESDPAEPE